MNRADLHKFSAGEDGLNHTIRLPWSRGEWTYATNGHILIRVPRLSDVDENPQAPDAKRLFAVSKQTEFVPVPACAPPPDVDCDWCGGKGKVREGRYAEKCTNCAGTGKVECRDGIDIGNVRFAKRYLALIQGWEIAPNGLGAAAWIRNGEATGLLMPIRF